MKRKAQILYAPFLALLLATSWSCEPEDVSEDRITVTLFHRSGFGLPQTFSPIAALRATVVDRATGQRLTQTLSRTETSFGFFKAENIPFGANRQLYVEGLGAIGQTLASGVTPGFDEVELDEPGNRNFLVYMTEVGGVSPLSAIFAGPKVDVSPFVLGPRAGHTASVLPDGRVLLVGGARLTGYNLGLKCAFGPCPTAIGNIAAIYDTMEVFDPSNGYFDAARRNDLGFRLSAPRVHHCTVQLLDGSLLVAGGLTVNANDQLVASKTADLISLEVGGFRLSTIELPEARVRHSCAITGNGTVVLTGGLRYNDEGEIIALDTADVLLPGSQMFQSVGRFEGARWDHASVAVGEVVMLTGGTNGQEVLATTQLLVNGQFLSKGSMQTGRYGHSLLHLNRDGGRYIVVAGGFTLFDDSQPTGTYEVFDITSTQGWVPELSAGSLQKARAYFDLVELHNGDLLVVGGIGVPDEGGRLGSLPSVELLSRETSATATFVSRAISSTLSAPRFDTASVVLPGGTVLITGGGRYEDGGFAAYQLSDVYNPGPPLSVSVP